MIFYNALGWNPELDPATLARYPKALICADPREEDLIICKGKKPNRSYATCMYLLNAIYANCANRLPTTQEIYANINSTKIEPLLLEVIADLEAGVNSLRARAIDRIDIEIEYDYSQRRVRIFWRPLVVAFYFDYFYYGESLCLSLEQIKSYGFVLNRDSDKPYEQGFDLDPELVRKLDRLLTDTCLSEVSNLPEIQAYHFAK